MEIPPLSEWQSRADLVFFLINILKKNDRFNSYKMRHIPKQSATKNKDLNQVLFVILTKEESKLTWATYGDSSSVGMTK